MCWKIILDSPGIIEAKIEKQWLSTDRVITLNFISRCPSFTAAFPAANTGGCIPTGAAMPGLGEPYHMVQMWFKCGTNGLSTINFVLCTIVCVFYLSIYLSFYISIYLSIYLSIHIYICIYIYIHVCVMCMRACIVLYIYIYYVYLCIIMYLYTSLSSLVYTCLIS